MTDTRLSKPAIPISLPTNPSTSVRSASVVRRTVSITVIVLLIDGDILIYRYGYGYSIIVIKLVALINHVIHCIPNHRGYTIIHPKVSLIIVSIVYDNDIQQS
jgi:hypothetical protein